MKRAAPSAFSGRRSSYRAGRLVPSRQFVLIAAGLAVLLAILSPYLPRVYRAWRGAMANKHLLAAAAANDVSGASIAIAAGARVEARNSHGQSAMDMAIENQHAPMVDLLIRKGARYDADTILAIAVREDAPALARQLLDAGANPDGKGWGFAPLHHCAERGATEMAELLLEFGANVEQPEPFTGRTPLIAAIGSGEPGEVRLRTVQLLLEHGANPAAETSGVTAMDLAVFDGNGPLGDLLRKYGADYGPREAVAFNRLSEVESMVRENPSILQARYRPDYPFARGQTASLLGIALHKGYRELAVLLAEHGAPLDAPEAHGLTLMHLSARGGDPQLIQWLADRGVEVNGRDDHRDTPLTDSAWSRSPEVISALIRAGADVNATRIDGRTALHLAVSHDRRETIPLLIAAGADPMIPDATGKTAIDVARARSSPIIDLLQRTEPPRGE